jgi:hypothetical protein
MNLDRARGWALPEGTGFHSQRIGGLSIASECERRAQLGAPVNSRRLDKLPHCCAGALVPGSKECRHFSHLRFNDTKSSNSTERRAELHDFVTLL